MGLRLLKDNRFIREKVERDIIVTGFPLKTCGPTVGALSE
jgi:hypothetical protein